MSSVLMGGDPGVSGALAFLDPLTRRLSLVAIPTHSVRTGRKTRNDVAAAELAKLISAAAPTHAYVEAVASRPGQGVTSMFRFGYAAGLLHGVLATLAIPMTFVTPQTWQRDMRVPKGDDGARVRAAQLFPGYAPLFARAKDNHAADAALIAAWGAAQP